MISPFINAAGLEHVWPDGNCTIVSRPESFAELGVDYLEQARDTWGAELSSSTTLLLFPTKTTTMQGFAGHFVACT